MRLVIPFQYLSPEMRQQVFFVFLHRGSVHLFVSNGPSSGVPWDAGVPRWKPLVLLFQNYWFISQIRQRKYFNLSWFICESEARLSGLEERLNKSQKSIQRWKCQDAGNKTCNDCNLRGKMDHLGSIHLDVSLWTTGKSCILWIGRKL